MGSTVKDTFQMIDFQTDFVQDLVRDCGADYPYNLDTTQIFYEWANHKIQDVLSYRDQSFASKFTGTKSPVHHTTFMKALDDTMDTFMNQKLWTACYVCSTHPDCKIGSRSQED